MLLDKAQIGMRIRLDIIHEIHRDRGLFYGMTGEIEEVDLETALIKIKLNEFSNGHGQEKNNWWVRPNQIEPMEDA